MNKYHVAPAEARTAHDITFDSRAEMRRYLELCMLQRAGEIKDLELQPEYVLVPPYSLRDGTKSRGVRYRADFRYLETGTNRIIVEDVKGMRTRDYLIKKALLLWRYPDLNFVEVKA